MCTKPKGKTRSLSKQNQAGPKKARKVGNLCPNFQKFLGHRKITSPNLSPIKRVHVCTKKERYMY